MCKVSKVSTDWNKFPLREKFEKLPIFEGISTAGRKKRQFNVQVKEKIKIVRPLPVIFVEPNIRSDALVHHVCSTMPKLFLLFS